MVWYNLTRDNDFVYSNQKCNKKFFICVLGSLFFRCIYLYVYQNLIYSSNLYSIHLNLHPHILPLPFVLPFVLSVDFDFYSPQTVSTSKLQAFAKPSPFILKEPKFLKPLCIFPLKHISTTYPFLRSLT